MTGHASNNPLHLSVNTAHSNNHGQPPSTSSANSELEPPPSAFSLQSMGDQIDHLAPRALMGDDGQAQQGHLQHHHHHAAPTTSSSSKPEQAVGRTDTVGSSSLLPPSASKKRANASKTEDTITSVTAQFHGHLLSSAEAAGAVSAEDSTTAKKQNVGTASQAHVGAAVGASVSASKFGIGPVEILEVLEARDLERFVALGGVQGMAKKLRTNVRNGLSVEYDARMGLYRPGTVKRGLSSSSSRSVTASESGHSTSSNTLISSNGNQLRADPEDDRSDAESSTGYPSEVEETDDEDLMPPDTPNGEAASMDMKVLGGTGPRAGAPALSPSKTIPPEGPEDFTDRKKVFGTNQLPPPKQVSFWEFAFEALKDKTLLVLCGAAVVDMIVGVYKTAFAQKKDPIAFVDGLAIVVAVVVIVMISAANDSRKQAQFRKLSDYSRSLAQTTTVRDGTHRQVPNAKLLVGDVCHVAAGDVLPADGIVIQSFNLSTDESSLTGESLAVRKGTEAGDDPFLLSGTKVVNGVGRMMVVATGPHSINGKLMAALEVEPEETPLQKKLGKLADQIGKFGLVASMFLVVGLIIVYAIFRSRKERTDTVTIVNDVINVLIIGVTLVVVAIPEGLPLAVTLALAHATLRMLKDNNLVRHLKACETMGNATTICSDKTGTLTQNRMTVVAGRFACHDFTGAEGVNEADARKSFEDTASKDGEKPPPSPIADGPVFPLAALPGQMHKTVLAHLCRSINVNTTADEVANAEGNVEFVGSKTEVALLEFTRALGYSYAADREGAEVLEVLPFSSDRKRMSTIVKAASAKKDPSAAKLEKYLYGGRGSTADKNLTIEAAASPASLPSEADDPLGEPVEGPAFPRATPSSQRTWLFCKGASEIVLASCEFYVDGTGRVRKLSPAVREGLKRLVERMAGRALRTIAVAFKPYVRKAEEGDAEDEGSGGTAAEGEARAESPAADRQPDEYGLVLGGIVGIEDPIRPEVPDAVAACHRAGIVVRMVTGDNLATARSIAEKAGLYKEGDLVLEGPVFRQLTQEQMDEMLPRLRVLARSSPHDKQVLVKNLKRLGETVAVTGDGTNDAPALRSADVGFSMGIAGTEVAKEASDIVLLDDNFVSLSKAIMWGRSVYDSVRKFLQFQLTVNVVAVTVTIVSSFLTACLSKENTPYSILSAVQLLWVNLIMDTFAALALATDPPTPDLLDRPPARKKDPLINFAMWKMIVGQSIYQIAICMGLYLAGSGILWNGSIINNDNLDTDTGVDRITTTMVFNTFVFCQVFNEFNSRIIGNSLNVFKDIHRNPTFWFIVVGTTLVQVLIVQFGGAAFKTYPLDAQQWGICIALGIGCMPFAVLIRLTPDWLVAPFLACLGRPPRPEDADCPRALEDDEESEEGERNGKETVVVAVVDTQKNETEAALDAREPAHKHEQLAAAHRAAPGLFLTSPTMNEADLPQAVQARGIDTIVSDSVSPVRAADNLAATNARALWTRARDVRRQIGVVNAFRGARPDWAVTQLPGAQRQRTGSFLSGVGGYVVAGAATEGASFRDDASIVSSHVSGAHNA
ncbi:hypothetical protein HDU96_009057 [Phlyctochytrium bullatum]|nr:hypothetical protein HDU96_009057 [Phlyctochytrium bullatum]